MENKTRNILNFLEKHQSEELQSTYIDSLFNKKTSARETLFDDIDRNRNVIRDIMYNAISESKQELLYCEAKDKIGKSLSKHDENRRAWSETNYAKEEVFAKNLLDDILQAAEKNGVSWCKEFVDAEKKSPFYEMNEALSVGNRYVYYVEGKDLKNDLYAIRRYREYGPYEDFEVYQAYADERDEMRAKLFGMIADGKTKYKLSELAEFYFSSKEGKGGYFHLSGEWTDKTSIFENEDKYPEYLRGMAAIEKKIETHIKDLTFEQKKLMLGQTRSEDVLKSLMKEGLTISLEDLKGRFSPEFIDKAIAENKILQDQAKNEEISKKLEDVKSRLEQKEQELNNKERYLGYKEQAVASERATSVNANEDFKGLSDAELKDKFELKKKLMKEHPIMLEPCLNSMCNAYVLTKDEAMKKEMLGELYAIRKGGKTDAEKREMAKTFKRVLDKNPNLKNDENLVALSKIDTVISQPTKSVKKQVEHSK